MFKEIQGHEGYYITEKGEIWSSYSNKYIVATKAKSGYFRIKITYPVKRPHALHRLVAIAYVPNPNNYPQVNHKDGNKENNAAENLEWCTASENVRHAWSKGLNEHLRSRIIETKNKKVLCVETGKVYNSAAEAGVLNGMRKTSVPTAISKGHKCNGLTFKYLGLGGQ